MQFSRTRFDDVSYELLRCDELADQLDAKKAQLSSAKKDLEAAISESAAFKVQGSGKG